MARPTKEQALQRDLKLRKVKFIEKILLVRPQIEDAIIDTALGKNPNANESKRLEMARLVYDIGEQYMKELDKADELEQALEDKDTPSSKPDDNDTTVVNFG